MSGEQLRVGADGAIAVLSDGLSQQLARQPGVYTLRPGPPGVWLLQREGGEAQAARGRVLMAGELVSRMTVVEIVNVIMTTHWRGELHIVAPGGRRVLSIDQGAVKHAQTEFVGERLGELLVHRGVLTRQQLRELLAVQGPDQRFGQLLVERQVLDQGALFGHLQSQTEAIFYACLLESSGLYWFVTAPDGAPAPPTTVHLPIQGLLMEGVQRIDEMALYRERIPHNRVYPQIKDDAEDKADKRDATMQRVFEACDGRRDLDDLARRTGLGEFQTVKAVYNLLRAGHITLQRGAALDADAARRMLRAFNEIMRDIFVVVATYGSMDEARRTLVGWLESGPHRDVLGHELDIDGTLDTERVLELLSGAELEQPMEHLHQALHELAAYALFTATSGLSRREEQALARDVNHRLKGLRL